MKYKIVYGNACIVSKEGDKRKIKYYKEQLSKTLSIPIDFIVLRYEDIELDNNKRFSECGLLDDCEIKVHLLVTMRRVHSREDCQLLVDFEDRLCDMKRKYCAKYNIKQIKLNDEDKFSDNEYCKDFLSKNIRFFQFSRAIMVRMTDKRGNCCDLEAFEDDKVQGIVAENKGDVLMVEQSIMDMGGCRLFEYAKLDYLSIFVGFSVSIYHCDEHLIDLTVNVSTEVSYLKKILSETLQWRPHCLSLIHGSENLDDGETVGFHKIEEGERIDVIKSIESDIFANDGSNVGICIHDGQLIREIKDIISEKLLIRFGSIRLFLEEEELEDEYRVDFAKFGVHRVLHMEIEDMSIISIENNVEGRSTSQDTIEENLHTSISTMNSCNHDSVHTRPPTNITISLMVLILQDIPMRDEIFTRIIVEGSCSVQGLKDAISRDLKINMCRLGVYYLCEIFDGGDLEMLGVEDNSVIILKEKQNCRNFNSQFVIKVRTMENNSEDVKVNEYLADHFLTVGGLKQIMRSQNNVSTDCMKMFLKGLELKDHVVIWELDVENDCELDLILDKDDRRVGEEVRFRVKNVLSGEDRDVSVNINENVLTLVGLLAEQFELDQGEFVLTYDEEILKNDITLNTYGIKDQDEIIVCHSLLIKYFVTADGNSARVNRYAFLPEDTVLNLKSRIKKRVKIETRFIQLSFGGECLEDHKLLKDVGIENESYLIMISTLSGG